MKYDLCLFDLDGTLTDPKEGIVNSMNYMLKSLGIQGSNPNDFVKYIGAPLQIALKEAFGFSDEEIIKATEKYRENYVVKGIFENTLYDGILELLEKLQKSGVKMAICTLKLTYFAEKVAKHFNFYKYFDIISGSDDEVRNTKKATIEHALEKLDPERKLRIVMIGDREHDVLAANELGIDSIGILWGYGSLQELENAKATMIVNSTTELYEKLQG